MLPFNVWPLFQIRKDNLLPPKQYAQIDNIHTPFYWWCNLNHQHDKKELEKTMACPWLTNSLLTYPSIIPPVPIFDSKSKLNGSRARRLDWGCLSGTFCWRPHGSHNGELPLGHIDCRLHTNKWHPLWSMSKTCSAKKQHALQRAQWLPLPDPQPFWEFYLLPTPSDIALLSRNDSG